MVSRIPESGQLYPEFSQLTQAEAWEEVERIGKLLDDPTWWQKYSSEDIQAAYDLAKEQGLLIEKKAPAEVIAALLKNLQEGRYIGPLETQRVDWSATKIMREIFQNFYDGMKPIAGRPTLDGVEAKTEHVITPSGSEVKFILKSPAEYDHRYLIHHGGTTKLDDLELAGEFGEGIKIASFLLLKRGLVDEVELGSDHWRAFYYLQELPPTEYPEPVRGLHLRAEFVETPCTGNYLTFQISKEKTRDWEGIFKQMRGFFYHSENEAFKNPTFESEFGGFKVLPEGQKGELYIAGQRYEYEKTEAWQNTLPGMHLWTKGKVLERRRDRSFVTRPEIVSDVIRPLVNSMSSEELTTTLNALHAYWKYPEERPEDLPEELVIRMIYALAPLRLTAESKVKPSRFPQDCVAKEEPSLSLNPYERTLQRVGFQVCLLEFRKLGMSTAREKILSLVDQSEKVTLNEKEEKRRTILQEVGDWLVGLAKEKNYEAMISSLGGSKGLNSYDRETISLVFEYFRLDKLPPITVKRTPTLKVKGGQGEIGLHAATTLFHEVFMAQESLDGTFIDSTLTYLHELAHNVSGDTDDYGSGFVRVNNFLQRMLLVVALEDPSKLKEWKERWEPSEARGVAQSKPKAKYSRYISRKE